MFGGNSVTCATMRMNSTTASSASTLVCNTFLLPNQMQKKKNFFLLFVLVSFIFFFFGAFLQFFFIFFYFDFPFCPFAGRHEYCVQCNSYSYSHFTDEMEYISKVLQRKGAKHEHILQYPRSWFPDRDEMRKWNVFY